MLDFSVLLLLILASVIVPLRNVEAFLRECLESIEAQSFTDWVALLTDDGLTDDYGTIHEENASVVVLDVMRSTYSYYKRCYAIPLCERMAFPLLLRSPLLYRFVKRL